MARSIWLERLVVTAAILLTVVGIGSFGIWEPWELEPRPSIDLFFRLFGVGELWARLPGALAGLMTGAFAFLLLRSTVSRRTGVIAIVLLASTPLFLLNTRLAMGDSLGMAAQAWVGVAAIRTSSAGRSSSPILDLTLLGAAVAVSAAVSGVLLGPLPPLLAVSGWMIVSQDDEPRPVSRWLLPSTSLLLLAGVAHAVIEDVPQVSVWLGGGALESNPPNWDEAAEIVFHAFAPWSAALPVAMVWALVARPSRPSSAQRIAWIALLWIGFGFASWTAYASRYGTPTFLAVLPLAVVVSLWLSEIDEQPSPQWSAAVTVALLAGLQIRDYALYPDSALRGLAASSLSVPESQHPLGGWVFVFSMTALVLCLFLVSSGTNRRPDPRRTVQWLRTKWDAPWPQRGWILLAASLLGVCFVFGLMCFFLDLRIASLVVRVGRIAFFAPLLLAAAILGLPWLRHLYGRLGSFRIFPVLAVALGAGAFIALSFQPALGQHFSPKPVYESYAELNKHHPGPLAAYRVPTTAARYYTEASIAEIPDRDGLLDFLASDGQRWVVVPAEELPSIDRSYRRRTGDHLYVADARSARLLLVASNPVPNRPNQSFIARVLRTEAPHAEHVVEASYDGRIELVGYDLDLPEGDFVGAGQAFTITWYWRVTGKPPTGYDVFVHIDGGGLRLNGDHEPLDGRYPLKLWETGDVIADRHKLKVPPNFRSGDYVIYVGWFQGNKRLPVESGAHDGSDRVRAGILPVR